LRQAAGQTLSYVSSRNHRDLLRSAPKNSTRQGVVRLADPEKAMQALSVLTVFGSFTPEASPPSFGFPWARCRRGSATLAGKIDSGSRLLRAKSTRAQSKIASAPPQKLPTLLRRNRPSCELRRVFERTMWPQACRFAPVRRSRRT
jgi:hypothetical protein